MDLLRLTMEEEKKSKLDMPLSKMKIHTLTVTQDIKTNIWQIETGYCVCSLSQSLSEISLT